MSSPPRQADPKPPSGANALGAIVAVVFATVAYYLAFGALTFQPKTFEIDLMPFYCGGEVVLERADPYRTEPLRSCEDRVARIARGTTPLVLPAPQPAYVLAEMGAFHAIPYPALRIAWAILEFLAFFFTVELLARMLPTSRWIIWAALGLSDFYCSFVLGQLAAFCTLGIVMTAWGSRKKSPAVVACGLALTALEPHIALPVFLALIAWGNPRERVCAIATAIALIGISIAFVPATVLREYAFDVLPAHALAEVSNQEQLSATYALHAIGFAPATALALAKVQYALFVIVGMVAAGPLAKRFDRMFLVFAPAAFAIVGGPFLHVTQISAGVPVALALAAYTDARRYACALCLLCVPWLNFVTVLTVLPLATACWAAIARYGAHASARTTWVAAAGATIIEGSAAFGVAHENFRRIAPGTPSQASDLAEVMWKANIDLNQHSHVAAATIGKLPTEIGLAIVLAGCLAPLAASIARDFGCSPFGRRSVL